MSKPTVFDFSAKTLVLAHFYADRITPEMLQEWGSAHFCEHLSSPTWCAVNTTDSVIVYENSGEMDEDEEGERDEGVSELESKLDDIKKSFSKWQQYPNDFIIFHNVSITSIGDVVSLFDTIKCECDPPFILIGISDVAKLDDILFVSADCASG